MFPRFPMPNLDLFDMDYMSRPAEAFEMELHAFSMNVLETQRSGGNLADARKELMYGGKIVLPQSALLLLTELNIELPIAFEISNKEDPELLTYAGVIEFIANEGLCHLPQWMMDRLELRQGSKILLQGTRLPKGEWVKLKPQSVDFLDIDDPKTALEFAITNYSCLTPHDIIDIHYRGKTYSVEILDVRPEGAPSIWVTDTDLEVEFEAPVGYKEPEPAPLPSMKTHVDAQVSEALRARATGTQVPFQGVGQSLGGELVVPDEPEPQEIASGPQPLDLPLGTYFFGYDVPPPKTQDAQKDEPSTFTGGGQTLLD